MKAEDYLIKIEEENGEYYSDAVTHDPLDRVYHRDAYVSDCPEDLTCGRNLGSWIAEVNRLRTLLVDNGIDPSPKEKK